MLEVKNLTVKYGSIKVADDVTFKVDEGQWLMVVGPNGAGKSTILNAITQGTPYDGQVLLNGEDIKKMRSVERARNVGVLMQNHFMGYDFTIDEIVRLGRYAHSSKFLKGGSDEDDDKVEEALELTGLKDIRHQSALTLSGGELQRAFLAQVFVQDPKLLLLDEPTNHLDLIYQKQVFDLITEWVKKPGRAVVSVVHDLSLAKAFGTKALLMNKGKIISEGNVSEVLDPSTLNTVYGMDVYEWMRKMLGQWQ
ncbi:MAG: ABC transporter ATP-binding protein [Parasporobacterium sp.]|nr:ABC transporter ATP-binding protein [Parasporobacterium sp.]